MMGSASNRLNCGYRGISRSTCLDRGCCWDTAVRDAPWCYQPEIIPRYTSSSSPPPRPSQCDYGDPDSRVDCGYDGVERHSCLARGCCWDASSIRSRPLCFHARNTHDDVASLYLPDFFYDYDYFHGTLAITVIHVCAVITAQAGSLSLSVSFIIA